MATINLLEGIKDTPPSQQPINLMGEAELSEAEALKYVVKKGMMDSIDGLRQIYGQITSDDELLEKLKTEDEKLKKIFDNKEYGTKAFSSYLGSAVVADPIGYIPILGWAKKAKTLSKATAYGAGMGALYGSIGYVGEGESRAFNAVAGSTFGGVLGLGGAGIVRGIQKAMGKNPSFAKPLQQRRQENIEKGAAQTKLSGAIPEEEIDKVAADAVEEIQKLKPAISLDRGIERFYKAVGGDKIWDVAVKNWGTGLSAAALGLGGYNAFDDEDATQGERITASLILALLGGGGAKIAGKIAFKDKTLSEIIQSGIVDNYGLPKGYSQLVKTTFGEVNELRNRFLESVQEIATLKPDERKAVYQLMVGDVNNLVDSGLGNFSTKARAVVKKAGQDMVDAGLLNEDIFLKNIDTYLHRTYAKHVLREGGNKNVYNAAKQIKVIGDELRRRGQKLDKVINRKTYERSFRKDSKNFGQYKDFDVEDIEVTVSAERYKKLNEKLAKKKTFKITDYKLNETVKDIRDWEVISDDGAELILRDKKRVALKRDYTKQEREELGEIEDAAFAMAETGRLMTNDLAVYKLYSNIAKNKEFSLDVDEFNKFLDEGQIRAENWVQIPVDNITKLPIKKYGQLAGKYVPQEVYNDLTKIQKLKEGGGPILENYLKVNRLWKKSKTAWNPVVHVNNTVSNVILYDLAGANYRFMSRGFKELSKGIEGDKSATLYNLAKANGVFDSDLVSRELTDETRDTLEEALKNLADELSPEILNAQKYSNQVFEGLQKNLQKGYDLSFKKLEDIYQLEDQAFRMGLFMDRLSKGMNVQEAAADAKKWFIDYDINAPFINLLRRFPTPFLSYTYRVMPLLAEAAVRRPWKFAKWAAMGYSLNEVGKGKYPFAEYFSEDPDFGRFKEEVGDEVSERALMRENLRNKMFGMPFLPETLIKTPFKSGRDKDTPLYIDVRRFIPGGDVFTVGDRGIGIPIPTFGTTEKDLSLKIPETFTPSFGALGEVFLPLLTGVDPFTLQKIDGLGLGNDEKVKFQHILSRLTPNIPTAAFTAPLFGPESPVVKYDPFSQSFGSKKVITALRQLESDNEKENLYGENYTPLESILSVFGFKLQPVTFSKLVGSKGREFEKLYGNVRRRYYRIAKQYREGKISQEDAETQINEVYKILERANKKTQAFRNEIKEREQRLVKFEGGEVDVPFAQEEPENRINPLTGEPYSVTAGSETITSVIEEREQKAIGGLAKLGGKVRKAFKAYHGSPHDFEKFDPEKIGTGEGFQVYGKGLYFTDTEDVAKFYKTKLEKNEDGKMYEVKINVDKKDLIDYDKPIGAQTKKNKEALDKIIDDLSPEDLIYFRNSSSIDTDDWINISKYYDKDENMFRESIKDVILDEDNNIKDFLKIINDIKGSGKAEKFLEDYDIKGLKYKDSSSRAVREGAPISQNYVIFDPRIIEISKKYGIAIPVAGAVLKELELKNEI